MKYPVVIFDLDGTLADTSFGIIHSLKAMEKELGLAGLPQETLRKFVGPVFSEALKEYYHVTEEQVPRMIEVFRKNYAQQGYKQTKPYPGIHRLLKEIKKLGGKIGVATVKNARMTELTLQELGLWDEFDYIASNHGEHIDKKTLILQVLQALACGDKSQAVLVGDTHYDGFGAKEAGIAFIAQMYGFGFSQGASPFGGFDCVFQAHTPEELASFLIGGGSL